MRYTEVSHTDSAGPGIILPGATDAALLEFHHSQNPDRAAINPTQEGELATEHAQDLRWSEAANQLADLSSGAWPIASSLESLLQGRPG